jgi:hypothetical protein
MKENINFYYSNIVFINPLKCIGYCMYSSFYLENYILLTWSIYEIIKIHRINRHYFPAQHQLVGLFHRDTLCCLSWELDSDILK